MRIIGRFHEFLKGLLTGRSPPLAPREAAPKTTDATIRLFVSSTFKDMQEEREALRRDVWPAVRRACEERGAAFLEVDLRWGVTGEEAERGEVLALCLDEIDRCRPWIMGLLGKRYGWVDPEAARRLAGREGFRDLLPYSGASVTELELRHAVINLPFDGPAPVQLLYLRGATPENTPFAELIDDLALANLSVKPTPDDMDAFAAVVRRDLLQLIAEKVPERPFMTRAERRSQALLEARGRNMARRPEAKQLFELMQKTGRRIAVTGPEGAGKSALIADATGRRLANGDIRVLLSLSPGGFQPWTAAFLDVLVQLGASTAGITGKGDLASHFAKAVSAAAALSSLCIVIDDVTSEDESWLPEPATNVTYVLGLRRSPGPGWTTIGLGLPSIDEARGIVAGYLLNFGKRLDEDQMRRICNQSRSARATAMLAEELRQVPRFEDVDSAIDQLAAVTDMQALADRVITRVIKDRGPASPQLLLALALSHEGLCEEVLRELYDEAEGHSVSRLEVALLLHALGGHVLEAEGRFCLREAALREAILARFGGKDKEATVRRAIAAAALRRAEEPGAAEEAVEQLAILDDRKALESALAVPLVAEALLRRAPEYYAAAWHGRDPGDVFGVWVGQQTPDRVALAAEFMARRRDTGLARILARDACDRASEPEHAGARLRALGVLARLAEEEGKFDEASTLLQAMSEAAEQSGLLGVAALVPVNSLRLDFLRNGREALTDRIDVVRRKAEASPDGRALMTLILVEGLAALEAKDRKAAVRHFEHLKRLALRDGDIATEAAAEAGLARVAHTKGKMAQVENLARRVLGVGEMLGDTRLQIEGLALLTLASIDDIRRFAETRALIAKRRALSSRDVVAAIEADFDEARLLARQDATKDIAMRLAQRAIRRSWEIGLTRRGLEEDLRVDI